MTFIFRAIYVAELQSLIKINYIRHLEKDEEKLFKLNDTRSWTKSHTLGAHSIRKGKSSTISQTNHQTSNLKMQTSQTHK